MNAAHARTARLASAVLVGGLATGALLALAVPTTMRHEVDNWREHIGTHNVAGDSGAGLLFEAPPEDLTPVSWQTAGQEYPSGLSQDEPVYAPVNLDANLDAGFADDQPSEALPAELMSSREPGEDALPAEQDDDAATSAQAASEAATDVKAVEAAAVDPENAHSSVSGAAGQAYVIRVSSSDQ